MPKNGRSPAVTLFRYQASVSLMFPRGQHLKRCRDIPPRVVLDSFFWRFLDNETPTAIAVGVSAGQPCDFAFRSTLSGRRSDRP